MEAEPGMDADGSRPELTESPELTDGQIYLDGKFTGCNEEERKAAEEWYAIMKAVNKEIPAMAEEDEQLQFVAIRLDPVTFEETY